MGSKRNLKRTLSWVIVLMMLSLAVTSGSVSANGNGSPNGRGLQMRMEAILPERMEDYLKFFGKKRRNK